MAYEVTQLDSYLFFPLRLRERSCIFRKENISTLHEENDQSSKNRFWYWDLAKAWKTMNFRIKYYVRVNGEHIEQDIT